MLFAAEFNFRNPRSEMPIMPPRLPLPAQTTDEKFLRQIFVRDQMAEWSKHPLIMERADGVFYWDVEGKRYYDEMADHGDVAWDSWLCQTEQVRDRLAHFIHAEARSIAFTYSTSHGINLIAGILDHCGDVLCPADEFPSCTLPWLQQRYRVHFVPSRDHGVIDLDDLQRSLTAETRVLVTSYVQFATGFRQRLVIGELRAGNWRVSCNSILRRQVGNVCRRILECLIRRWRTVTRASC